MRLPRFRLKLWVLILLVGMVAVCIGGEQMRRRRVYYLKQAAENAHMEEGMRWLAERLVPKIAGIKAEIAKMREEAQREPPESRSSTEDLIRMQEDHLRIKVNDLEYDRRRSDYYGRLKRKYEHAASHPWATVQPEPE